MAELVFERQAAAEYRIASGRRYAVGRQQSTAAHVSCGSLADIATALPNVRF
jgi:hypothetical protein